MDWASSIVSVAEIASRILPLFLSEDGQGPDGAEGATYTSGPVTWKLSTEDAVLAENKSPSDLGLFFSKPVPRGSVSMYVPVPGNKTAKMTKSIEEFRTGDLTIAPTNSDGNPDLPPGMRLVTGSFSLLVLGAVINVIGGVKFGFKREGDGFVGYFETTGRKLENVSYTIKDSKGNSVKGKARFGSADDTLTFKIPPGVNIDPLAEEVALEIVVDEETFAEISAEQSHLLVA